MVYGQLAAAGLREGKRVAEGGDRFAELVLDFGFGILEFRFDLGPIQFDEFRVVDGMRAEVDAVSAQFADFIPS